jgi:hypothetical protein
MRMMAAPSIHKNHDNSKIYAFSTTTPPPQKKYPPKVRIANNLRY